MDCHELAITAYDLANREDVLVQDIAPPGKTYKHPLKPLNPGGFGLNVSGRVTKGVETDVGFMTR